MKTGKKLLCLILSAVMVFGTFSSGVMAEDLIIEEDIHMDGAVITPDTEAAGNGAASPDDENLILDVEMIESGNQNGSLVQSESDSQTESETWNDSEIQTESKSQMESETQAESEIPMESEIQMGSEIQVESEILTDSEIQAESEIQTSPESQVESEIQTDSEYQTEESLTDLTVTEIVVETENLEELEGLLSAEAEQSEIKGSFILSVDTANGLVIPPEYISYTEGQTVKEALLASGHTFTGMDTGMITAIDGVTGNYRRSDESGDYDLEKSAADIKYFRFSEDTDVKPGSGLQNLMKAMADYMQKDADVKNAAKKAYETACRQFSGLDDSSAQVLADNLNQAVSDYEKTLTGELYEVTFSDGANVYAASSCPGVSITAENPYGKVWTDEGDGVLQLPAGSYQFSIRQDGLSVEGAISVSENTTVNAALPRELWMKQDAFRISGSYGAEDNEENKFTDDEFTVGAWEDRRTAVVVPDTFTGKIYAYVEYDAALFTEDVPALTAVFADAQTGAKTEKELPFQSLTSGVSGVLTRGAGENTIVYSICHTESDGYLYAQDYTVTLERRPTLTAISVKDQDGIDQTAMTAFDGTTAEYVYKVLDTVTSVKVVAAPLDKSYTVTVNGTPMEAGGTEVQLEKNGTVSAETSIKVVVTANGYSSKYVLTIRPGEGKKLSFATEKPDVTVEVVNRNGMVMPYQRFKEGESGNRYQYILVPGETYSYIATCGIWYHAEDEFTMENAADSTIWLDVPTEDWLTELAFGKKSSAKYKNTLSMNQTFTPDNHSYQVSYVDTEHEAYIWTAAGSQDVKIEAIYDQIFGSSLYHNKKYTLELDSGLAKGTSLKRFLMKENPFGNTVTIRLTKESNGITYFQDYAVEFVRTLTLKDISAKCDGISAALVQKDGTIGFDPDVKEYEMKVSMAAKTVKLDISRYTDNPCYGEAEVGYRIKADGVDVTEAGGAEVALDGTMDTQTVTITVENEKAPEGTDYILHILKSPPVETVFKFQPTNAVLNIREVLSGERLWCQDNGTYQLCEGYDYDYNLTQYGYVSRTGRLSVTRDEAKRLVITDGSDTYLVSEQEDGSGAVTISWTLEKAAVNETIPVDMEAEWNNFRGNEENNAVTDTSIPTRAEDGTLYWANQIGEGFDADAVGSPILAGDYLITYAGDKLYRVDTVTGEVMATGTMDHKSSFSITPPAYAEGMIFVALSNGTVQAFNADTLESLWIYKDPLGGQPNCPLTIKNGYLYTGFWNSETAKANFVCLSITDEDPGNTSERKNASWYHTREGGFYWAGAYASDQFVMVGTDDGDNTCTSQTSSLLLLDGKTGALLDRLDGLNGDVRSTVVYDRTTDAYYFTSKGGTFYSVQVENLKFKNMWSVALCNDTGGIPMSTCSPSVYNGRAYVGVSGAGQFTAYSGHNITVIDLTKREIAYKVETQGYPQTSGLLTTAYEKESGYVYVYFFENMTPGKLCVLRDKPGQTSADYVTTENDKTTAYTLFTPVGDQAQYAICSPIVDKYGTIYFKNDSAHLMAYGSAVKNIEVTVKPDRMVYVAGEHFDPAGMTVTATYVNGMTRDITRYVTYSEGAITAENPVVTISFEHVMYHNTENGTGMNAGVETATPVTTLTVNVIDAATEAAAGDVNLDGKVDEKDAQLVVSCYYGVRTLNEKQKNAADLNKDGVIDIRDANLIISACTGNKTS